MFSRTITRLPRQLFSVSAVRCSSHYRMCNYNPLVECESQKTSRNISTIVSNKTTTSSREELVIQRQNAFIFISAKLFAILGLFAMFGISDVKEIHEDFT